MESAPKGGGVDLEGVRPGRSGLICVSRNDTLSALVVPHASSSLLLGVLERVCQDVISLLLVAPFWPAQVWFADLTFLLCGSPKEIPIRKDLLSQAGGTLFIPSRICRNYRFGP